MFNKMKKMIAGLLATVMITTNVCPMVSVSATSGVASLESLGKFESVVSEVLKAITEAIATEEQMKIYTVTIKQSLKVTETYALVFHSLFFVL